MKKSLVGALVVICLLGFASPAHAAKNESLKKIGDVMGRGALNLVGFPWELVTTPPQEKEHHPKLWPATFLPRTACNMLARIASGATDLVCFSWAAPFNERMTPLTEHFSMPEYPWQKL